MSDQSGERQILQINRMELAYKTDMHGTTAVVNINTGPKDRRPGSGTY